MRQKWSKNPTVRWWNILLIKVGKVGVFEIFSPKWLGSLDELFTFLHICFSCSASQRRLLTFACRRQRTSCGKIDSFAELSAAALQSCPELSGHPNSEATPYLSQDASHTVLTQRVTDFPFSRLCNYNVVLTRHVKNVVVFC